MLIKHKGSFPKTTCYCCGITRGQDYTTLFDLGYKGIDLVDICDECHSKANDLGLYSKEGLCAKCSEYDSYDSTTFLCYDCNMREIVQEMHDELPVIEWQDGSQAIVNRDGILEDVGAR